MTLRYDRTGLAPSSHPALSRADGVAALWEDFLLLVARACLGWMFILYAWRKLTGMDAFIKTLVDRSVPAPTIMGWIAAPVEFLGGLAILLGIGTRYAALVMVLFVIFATVSSHRYWDFPAAQRGGQESHFWKNITIIGGMLLLFVTAGGRFSLDALLWRNKDARR
jgi:putative oxidoreductase